MDQQHRAEFASNKEMEKTNLRSSHERSRVSEFSVLSRNSFLIVFLVNMILFMGTSLPTPLYRLYGVELSLSSTLTTVIFASCPIAIIPSLFLFGPLGDIWGRKRVLIAAVIVAIVGNALLVISQGWPWLVLGRIGQGVAVGAASGNATAAMIEFEPNGNKRRASQMAGISLFSGLVIGPLLSGFMAEWLPAPTRLVFLVDMVLLMIVLGILFTLKETSIFSGVRAALYRFSITTDTKLCFLSMSLSTGFAYALSGLYFSLMPAYAEALLKGSIGLGSAIVSLMVFVSMVIQLVIPGIQPKRLVIIGQLSMASGLALVVLAQIQVSAVILFFGAAICGIAYGATFLGGIAAINAISPKGQRGSVTSSFYAIAQLFLAVPIVILGFAMESVNVLYAVKYFALVLSIVAVVNMVLVSLLNLNCGTEKNISQ